MPSVEELWEPMKVSVPMVYAEVHDIILTVGSLGVDWGDQMDMAMSVELFLPTDYDPPRYPGSGNVKSSTSSRTRGSNSGGVAEDVAKQFNDSEVCT